MIADTAAPTTPNRRLFAHLPQMTWLGAIGLAILAGNILVTVIGPLVAPHTMAGLVGGGAFLPASKIALLGTDYLGRDLLSRLLIGAHYSLGIAAVATILGFATGMAIGFSAAELRGSYDMVVTWLSDIMLSFPSILLALLVITAVGSSVPVLIGTIAFIQMPRIIRVSRSIAIGISTLEFVEAARARGERLPSILIREILPNASQLLAVEFGLRMSFAILFISSLSFLGLGLQPPAADWGGMVRENLPGIYYGSSAPIIPALLIGLLVLGINLTVDWLSGGSTGNQLSESR